MVRRGKFFICFFVLLALLVIPALMVTVEEPVSSQSRADDQEINSAIESIIKQVKEYSKAGNFEEALKQLNIALEKFPQKEYREKLQIELADIHSGWALSLYKKYDYANAIKHFEMAYAIDKNYRPKNAAVDLNNIGFLSAALGQNQKALEFYEKALPVRKKVGDRNGEAATLNNIGIVYDAIGQKQKALEFYRKALPIVKKGGHRTGEAKTLSNIGRVYDALGQKQKALEFYQEALIIQKEMVDRYGESVTLHNIGIVYDALGQKQKALEFYRNALTIEKEVGNRTMEASTLNNIGLVYSSLGQKQKALEFYQEALTIHKELGNRSGEAVTLNNIGRVYDVLGQKQKALEFYREALPIREEVGDRAGEAVTLNNIGGVYEDLGQKQKALEFYQEALPIFQALGDRAGEAAALSNIGLVYSDLGQKQKALEFYQEALPIVQAVGDRAREAKTLSNLMLCWKSLKNTPFSIFYGKQSVNTFQNLRANISKLDRETKKIYLEKEKNTYRYLAGFLIAEGRLSEAQNVLDMLKEKEYFEFTSKDQSTTPTYSQMDFTRFENQWLDKYNKVTKDYSSISGDYYLLKKKEIKSDAEKKRMKELEASLEQY